MAAINALNPTASNTWFGKSYVGLDLKLPLLTGENTNRNIQRILLQFNKYVLQREDKMQQYRMNVFSAQIKLNQMERKVKAQEENLALIKESFGIFQMRAAEGRESALNLNIVDANIQLLQSNFASNTRQR